MNKRVFKLGYYNGNYAMYCKGKEQLIEFCNFLHSSGRKWNDGTEYIDESKIDVICKKNEDGEYIVIYFNSGEYGSITYALAEDYTVLPWSELRKNEDVGRKVFRFEDYNGNYVMHCKTKEEAIEFCKLMHDDGRTWLSNVSYLKDSFLNRCKENTCYYFNEGLYGDLKFATCKGYTILKWSDFTTEELSNED